MLFVVAGIVLGVAVAAFAATAARRRGTPRLPPIDPFTLGERWRRHVAAAQSTERRFNEIARATAPGPLRDRLGEIGRQVQQAVHECFAIARRGHELDDALRRFNTSSLTAQLESATDEGARSSLTAQLESAGRIRATRDSTDERLRLLTTRMGELLAHAAEVSVGSDATEELGTGVDEVVTQLESLRLALNDVNNTGRPATSP